MYTIYETSVLREIQDWERAKPGFMLKTIDAIGKPVSLILSRAPESVKFTCEKAIFGFMEMLKDVSYWSYSKKSIIRKANNIGVHVDSIEDLAQQDIEKLDLIARSCFTSAKIIAALEGAGCGCGGLGLIAADIPVLMAIGFRSIQRIGSSYGFNMQDPSLFPVVLRVYSAGSGSSVAVKSSVLADMHITAASLAGKTAYTKAAARTRTSMLVNMLEHSAHSFPSHIAENISKRKLSQMIPVIGAAMGAGFNYWLMSNIMTASYMVFRKLYLERRHPASEGSPARRFAVRPMKLVTRFFYSS